VFSSSNNKKALSRDYLVIVGASGSGKTALFYKLLTKDHRDTLSSTDVNKTVCGKPVEILIPSATPTPTPQDSSPDSATP